ncbi:PREDICTED: uncharacterized protein LOC109154920 [Ipomoea nil]|uniref:uncharacterized protein LOC109154920 n=1 Tax=Ipomoea nil TaxID=35883 RepID=UPI00090174D7|nr:PREDICTED: uncharacterized protein LOC109154920 [Ipomoea nil]
MKKARASKMLKVKKSSRRPPRRGTPVINKNLPLNHPQHSEDIIMDPIPITQIPFEDIYPPPGNPSLPLESSLTENPQLESPSDPNAEEEPTGSEGIFGELIVDLDQITHQQGEDLLTHEKTPASEEEIRKSESNPEIRVTNSDTIDSFEKELDEIPTEVRIDDHETAPNLTPSNLDDQPSKGDNPDEILRKRRRVDPYEGADPRAKRPYQGKSQRKYTSKEKGKQTAEIDVETTLPTSDLLPPLNNQFQDKASNNLWHKISLRKIIHQKLVSLENLKDGEHIIEFLIQGRLLDIVTKIEPFEEKMIHGFYCNLKGESSVPSSPLYGKVYLREKYYDSSPDVINASYNTLKQDDQFNHNGDIIAQEITAGNVVLEKKNIKAACLTSKYAILQKISLSNWMPSLHENTVKWSLAELLYKVGKKVKINYGELVHQQVINLAENKSPKASLIFPNLIQTILTRQGLKTTKKKLQPIKALNVSVKLKKGSHQNDLRTTNPEDDPMNNEILRKYFQKRLNELNTSEKNIKQRQLKIQEEKVEVLKWLTALGGNNEEESDREAKKSQGVDADEEKSEGEIEKSQEEDADAEDQEEESQGEEQGIETP